MLFHTVMLLYFCTQLWSLINFVQGKRVWTGLCSSHCATILIEQEEMTKTAVSHGSWSSFCIFLFFYLLASYSPEEGEHTKGHVSAVMAQKWAAEQPNLPVSIWPRFMSFYTKTVLWKNPMHMTRRWKHWAGVESRRFMSRKNSVVIGKRRSTEFPTEVLDTEIKGLMNKLRHRVL